MLMSGAFGRGGDSELRGYNLLQKELLYTGLELVGLNSVRSKWQGNESLERIQDTQNRDRDP